MFIKNLAGALALTSCVVFGAISVEPSTVLFENEQVKVLRALEKPHVKGKFHEHPMNRVMVYLQPGRQRFEFQDGRPPKVFDWKEGQVEWSPPDGMHSPEVLSDAPFNIIEVLLKTRGTDKAITDSLDPLKLDPKHYKLELENSSVRVFRVTVEPHGSTPMHQHSLNRVTVFLTDQDFRTEDQDGKVTTVHHKAGEAAWGTPLTHKEENLSDKPFEAVTVELKN